MVRSSIFEQVSLVGEGRFLAGRTVYSLVGDVIAYVSIALTVLAATFCKGTPWISMTCYGGMKT